MKDFLKDVPKLEDLPKALYKGEVVSVFGSNDMGLFLIKLNTELLKCDWVLESELSPIPELTHWEASDFHKWFAENGMESIWALGISGTWYDIYAISGRYLIGESGEKIVYLYEVKSIKKGVDGIETPCTKPIKS